MEDLKEVIAKNIIRLRTQAGMTQAELGNQLNYSDKSISKWERAAAMPDVQVLKDMAEIFQVTIDYMVHTHDGDEQIQLSTVNSNAIISVALLGIWAFALLVFVVLWIFETICWQVFVCALPVCLVSWLVLNSIFNKGKHNYFIISGLILSIPVMLYLLFLRQNPWQLFLLAIPAELLVYLSFRIKTRRKKA